MIFKYNQPYFPRQFDSRNLWGRSYYPNCLVIASFAFLPLQQVPWLHLVEVVKARYDSVIVKWGLGKYESVNCEEVIDAGKVLASILVYWQQRWELQENWGDIHPLGWDEGLDIQYQQVGEKTEKKTRQRKEVPMLKNFMFRIAIKTFI